MRKLGLLCVFVFSLVSSVFAQKEQTVPFNIVENIADCDTVWSSPDVQASYPGGVNAMYAFLNDNMKNKGKITVFSTQRMMLRLIVAADGTIATTEVVKEVSPAITEDVVATIAKFPKMNPAQKNGKAVCGYFLIRLNLAE
jgi:hypothetical protein